MAISTRFDGRYKRFWMNSDMWIFHGIIYLMSFWHCVRCNFPLQTHWRCSHRQTQNEPKDSSESCLYFVSFKTRLQSFICAIVYLCDWVGDSIQMGIKEGLLNLPRNVDTPVIYCIGPGTRIASMRFVIEQRIDAGAHRKGCYTTVYFIIYTNSKLSQWMSYISDVGHLPKTNILGDE